MGVDVRLAESGKEALAWVADEVPDIVFMDIQMPDMSGEKVMQALFEIYGQDAMPIVAVSASVLAHQRQFYLDAGFVDFIDKPVQLSRIYNCLSALLGVTFVLAESGVSESREMTATHLRDVTLAETLWVNLKEAATNHSITDLRQQIAHLETLGDVERYVAAQLKPLAQQFDMAGVLKLLETIRHA